MMSELKARFAVQVPRLPFAGGEREDASEKLGKLQHFEITVTYVE